MLLQESWLAFEELAHLQEWLVDSNCFGAFPTLIPSKSGIVTELIIYVALGHYTSNVVQWDNSKSWVTSILRELLFKSWLLHFLKFFKYLFFFHLKGTVYREREETKKMFFHALVNFPNGWNDQSWIDLRLGARHFFLVSHRGAGCQGHGTSFTSFPGHKQRSEYEMEHQETLTSALKRCWCTALPAMLLCVWFRSHILPLWKPCFCSQFGSGPKQISTMSLRRQRT